MKRLLSALVLLLAVSFGTAEEPKNALFDELVNDGIAIPGGPKFKLPAPFLKPGDATKSR